MSNESHWESMLDIFVFETLQLTEQLEQIILETEKTRSFEASIDDIFRVMHTIKGNAAMMQIDNLAALAHNLEDIFYFLREKFPPELDYLSLTDILLKAVDFIKNEIAAIKQGNQAAGDPGDLTVLCREYLNYLNTAAISARPAELKEESALKPDELPVKQPLPDRFKLYRMLIFLEDNCGMENVRAYLLLRRLEELAVAEVSCNPPDIAENEASSLQISQEGFTMEFKSELSEDIIFAHMQKTAFVKSIEIHEVGVEQQLLPTEKNAERIEPHPQQLPAAGHDKSDSFSGQLKSSLISVNLAKLDKLMDLIGELVIAEAMVTQNPEIQGLHLDNFNKAGRQLKKITHDLQDIVMSIRMVPLSVTFQKMHRIVRDMSHSLNKQVQLELIGEDTEVDKNIIEQISDPLIHLVRNAVDHGIEDIQARRTAGKAETGLIKLEARNIGGDVWIIVSDDGRGLDKDIILNKARQQGLIAKNENDLSERDIYSCILLPGFSTKNEVSEFSGRGVGMDVVNKNISKIGGSILIDSHPGKGTVVSLKIPLTLAIIDGMVLRVGTSSFTIPMSSIRESFSIHNCNIITDPAGNEMILVRGEAYPVFRLHQIYAMHNKQPPGQEGIIIMVEYEGKTVCLLADALLGEQQVVIKPLPAFLSRARDKARGISSCTLLGDGTISLILDIADLLNLC